MGTTCIAIQTYGFEMRQNDAAFSMEDPKYCIDE